MMLSRHDLVWLSREGWDAARRTAAPAHVPVIDRWSRAGWPATVRRQDADAAPQEICLGMTPPRDGPGGARMRVGLRCNRDHIGKVMRPLELAAAAPAVPEQWKPAYQVLCSSIGRLDVRVYGSLAMQALTGRPYLTGRSDIDLAFYPASIDELDGGNRLFGMSEDMLPLDGEVVFPSGRAVAWKEWRTASAGRDRVLVKELNRVALYRVDELLSELAEPACPY